MNVTYSGVPYNSTPLKTENGKKEHSHKQYHEFQLLLDNHSIVLYVISIHISFRYLF